MNLGVFQDLKDHKAEKRLSLFMKASLRRASRLGEQYLYYKLKISKFGRCERCISKSISSSGSSILDKSRWVCEGMIGKMSSHNPASRFHLSSRAINLSLRHCFGNMCNIETGTPSLIMEMYLNRVERSWSITSWQENPRPYPGWISITRGGKFPREQSSMSD
jgi:hypothetical protein